MVEKIHKFETSELATGAVLETSQDILAEELLKNLNTTPIGQLLKKIASLPEIRQEKVSDLRGRIKQGDYDLNSRLELALDKVLEDMIS